MLAWLLLLLLLYACACDRKFHGRMFYSDRQRDRQTDRQTDSQPARQADRQTDTSLLSLSLSLTAPSPGTKTDDVSTVDVHHALMFFSIFGVGQTTHVVLRRQRLT